MKFVRNRRQGLRGRTGTPPSPVLHLNREAVNAAIEQARGTMGLIVRDARQFRLQSNARLETISDQALRESVGLSARAQPMSRAIYTGVDSGRTAEVESSVLTTGTVPITF